MTGRPITCLKKSEGLFLSTSPPALVSISLSLFLSLSLRTKEKKNEKRKKKRQSQKPPRFFSCSFFSNFSFFCSLDFSLLTFLFFVFLLSLLTFLF